MRKQQKFNPATPSSMRYRKELPALYAERLSREFEGCGEVNFLVRQLPNPTRATRGVQLRGWLNARAKGLHRTIRRDLWASPAKAKLRAAIRLVRLDMSPDQVRECLQQALSPAA
jgi:hypothetical protein